MPCLKRKKRPFGFSFIVANWIWPCWLPNRREKTKQPQLSAVRCFSEVYPHRSPLFFHSSGIVCLNADAFQNPEHIIHIRNTAYLQLVANLICHWLIGWLNTTASQSYIFVTLLVFHGSIGSSLNSLRRNRSATAATLLSFVAVGTSLLLVLCATLCCRHACWRRKFCGWSRVSYCRIISNVFCRHDFFLLVRLARSK